MADHVFVLPHGQATNLGSALRLLVFEDGAYGIEHRCKEVGDGDHLVVAPKLKHVVTGEWPKVTVRPSVLCPDCGLHGFITDGAWRSV